VHQRGRKTQDRGKALNHLLICNQESDLRGGRLSLRRKRLGERRNVKHIEGSATRRRGGRKSQRRREVCVVLFLFKKRSQPRTSKKGISADETAADHPFLGVPENIKKKKTRMRKGGRNRQSGCH